MKKVLEFRIMIMMIVILFIFSIFGVKLIELQVINGEEYFAKSNSQIRINQNVSAARGDIVDVNGEFMATSVSLFNVVLNKAYLADADTNDRINQTAKILIEQGETLNDILPISLEKPYEFKEGKTNEIKRVREFLELNIYATEENVLEKLVEKYKLEEYTQQEQRIIAGIRYTMERDGYSLGYPFNLAKDVSYETCVLIREMSRSLIGVEVQETSKRYYPDGSLTPHVLGMVGPIYAEEYAVLKEQGYKMNDTIGKNGLEKVYDSYLKGTDGIEQIEKNKQGDLLDEDIVLTPNPGDTLKLTIDAELQKAVNEILVDQVEIVRGFSHQWGKETEGVSVVVLDVETGGVLALSNYPSYDLNLYYQNYNEYLLDKEKPLYNRALQGEYRPGSVFKVTTATAALKEGLIDENYVYNCKGVYDYYTLEEWGGNKLPSCANSIAHGLINVEQALKVSCNCFFYDLGRQLGIDIMNETAHNYGLGVKTGIETGEASGVLSSPEHSAELNAEWNAGNLIQVAIGQLDTLVTTIQLATYANTVANDGVRLNTHIIDSIESYDGSEIKYKTPVTEIAKIDADPHVFDVIENGMVMASTEGSASMYLSELPYKIASKTGTAQVSNDLYNATMIAYGPVENPKLAIGIIAEKAGNGYNFAYSIKEIFKAYDSILAQRELENMSK